MAVASLIKDAAVSDSVIKTLVKNGLVIEFEEEVRRDPLAHAESSADKRISPSPSAQANALHSIEEPLSAKSIRATSCCTAVTGSGKTEVYLQRDAARSGD